MVSDDIKEPLDLTLSTRWASLECEITGKMSYCLRTSGHWGSMVPLVFKDQLFGASFYSMSYPVSLPQTLLALKFALLVSVEFPGFGFWAPTVTVHLTSLCPSFLDGY